MTKEPAHRPRTCIRLKVMTRKVGLRISATIKDCDSCTNRGRNFKTEKKVGFNINILVKYRKVRNLRKFDHNGYTHRIDNSQIAKVYGLHQDLTQQDSQTGMGVRRSVSMMKALVGPKTAV